MVLFEQFIIVCGTLNLEEFTGFDTFLIINWTHVFDGLLRDPNKNSRQRYYCTYLEFVHICNIEQFFKSLRAL